MTTLTANSPLTVVDALRGDPAVRPLSNLTSAAGLRAQLEDGIFEILGAVAPSSPLVVRASTLSDRAKAVDLSTSPLGRMRGILLSQLLRLLSVSAIINDPFEDSLAAWRAQSDATELMERFDRLDNDERARLEADVAAHAATLRNTLGEVPGRWLPRSAVRATQRCAGGHVVLRDVVDLMVGSASGNVASVALFDLTTSPLAGGAERIMRYHALVETLRTSTAPLRTSMFSTATGDLWTLEVDHEMMSRSADEVLLALRDQWKSQ